MSLKVGVLRFPGTNCDWDIWNAVEQKGHTPSWLWHADRFEAKEFDAFILPGGFSYGDYLRSGALAAHAPAMSSLKEAAQRGAPIFGICNGFQILCEAGLLPGALLRNEGRRFIDQQVELRMITPHSLFGKSLKRDQVLKMPIAHADGRFYASEEELKRIVDNEQVFCVYSSNPNGSAQSIAGVMNASRNVVGMMPHPERAMSDWMGSKDGYEFF